MWLKAISATVGLLAWSSVAAAQFQPGFGSGGMPYGGYGGYGGGYGGYGGGFGGGFGGGGQFMPNIYNPQTQPLSPYLNMTRGGGNPAANYYFGTRPGTVGGGGGWGLAPNMAFGGNRGPFPFQYTPEEQLPQGEPAEGYVLPPAGHPVMFGNTMGYYPSPFGYGRGGMRSGMQGMGGNRPGGQSQTPTPKR
jgi:hypothetical protein